MTATFGCVILTMGDRPSELQRAVDSVIAQEDVEVDCLVVVNGGTGHCDVRGARLVILPANLGIPAGRNRGFAQVKGSKVLFLDDDGYLVQPDSLKRASTLFEGDPSLGVISMRVTDPSGHRGQRRHVPRLRAGEPSRSSDVTTFLGGACIVRRSVFERVGGFPEDFFFGHEETSLAWRALDAGYRIRYDGSLVVQHPSTPPSRHGHFYYLSSRNRVWLARMHLPLPLAVTYGLVWLLLSLGRAASARGRREVLRGYRDGLMESPRTTRRPISWRTAWSMARIGRPPIV